MYYLHWIIYLLAILAIIYFIYLIYVKYKRNNTSAATATNNKRITAYIINMDKNKDRMEMVSEIYENSEFHEMIPYRRFPAIVGANVDIHEWLTEEAIIDLKQVENKKYRNYHYQLTRGAIGCFLSHYALAKQLLSDTQNDYYFNLEDDITIEKGALNRFWEALANAPADWDFILFGYHRLLHSEIVNRDFGRVTGFWGTHGVLMNKKGAKAFVDYVDQYKIDGQIDAYMARMAQQGKIALYAYRHPIFYTNTELYTDIQVPLKPRKDVDPFNFRGYQV